jgi:hypothetical protein
MRRGTIRLTVDTDERLQSTAKVKGYANPSGFLRAVIDYEMSWREDTMIGAEKRLAASLEAHAPGDLPAGPRPTSPICFRGQPR